MTQPKLELIELTKEFEGGSVAAVDGVDLRVDAGETLALLGPSGCGKSTLLNMIVGLEMPSAGDIHVDGKSVLGLPAGQRNIGLVFQDYAVFTHMSVAKNLSFGLEVRGLAKAEIERAVYEVADLLDMRAQLNVRASELGGSELQRVAIGRTLVTKPSILLLDEPLSNLEAGARLAMRRELRRLQSEIGLTIIYVTHDQIEALSLANRIAVMSHGKIRQVERTAVIFDRPDHLFVASFLGSPPMNLLRGHLMRNAAEAVFESAHLALTLPLASDAAVEGSARTQAILGIRPESVQLTDPAHAPWAGRVVLVELRGYEAVVTLELGPQSIKVVTLASERPAEGATVGLRFDAASCVLFDGDTSHRLVA